MVSLGSFFFRLEREGFSGLVRGEFYRFDEGESYFCGFLFALWLFTRLSFSHIRSLHFLYFLASPLRI